MRTAALRRQARYAAIISDHEKSKAYIQAKAEAVLVPGGYTPAEIARRANRILRGQ